jgi:hypothetical protein
MIRNMLATRPSQYCSGLSGAMNVLIVSIFRSTVYAINEIAQETIVHQQNKLTDSGLFLS